MKFFNKNVKIALTVLLGLVLLYWGINYLKGGWITQGFPNHRQRIPGGTGI